LTGPFFSYFSLILDLIVNRRKFLKDGSLGLASATLAGINPAWGLVRTPGKTINLWIGTYADRPDEGINLCRMDLADGSIQTDKLFPNIVKPSFLAADIGRRLLYAVSETGDYEGKPTGSVSVYRLDRAGSRIGLLNTRSTRGAHPCHVTVSRNGRFVLVANYTGGNIAVLPVMPDRSLGEAVETVQHEGNGPVRGRQEQAHAHSVNLSPDNRFAYACDLGMDKIMIYRFNDRTGKLSGAEMSCFRTAPGAGPRHFTFSPDGREAFVINELNSTITYLAIDPGNGSLSERQTVSTLPADCTVGNTCADIHVHPNGRFVYGSNRGHDSVVVCLIDRKSGSLKVVQQQSTLGKTPRNFAIDPSGKYLLAANQNSDSIHVFAINETTGLLAPTGYSVRVPKPVCILIIQD